MASPKAGCTRGAGQRLFAHRPLAARGSPDMKSSGMPACGRVHSLKPDMFAHHSKLHLDSKTCQHSFRLQVSAHATCIWVYSRCHWLGAGRRLSVHYSLPGWMPMHMTSPSTQTVVWPAAFAEHLAQQSDTLDAFEALPAARYKTRVQQSVPVDLTSKL